MASTPRSRRSNRAAKSSAAATAAASSVVTSRPRASFIALPLAWRAVGGKAAPRRRNAVMPIASNAKANAVGHLAACVDRNRWWGLVTHEYRLQHVRLELPAMIFTQHAFGDQVRDQHRRLGLRRRRAHGGTVEADDAQHLRTARLARFDQ